MRRALLRLAKTAGAAAITVVAASVAPAALAQTGSYPNQPVKILVGFSPGGPADLITREVAKGLQELWGQNVVVENKPGAASQIAAVAAVRAAPDGYTLFLGSDTTVVVLPFLREKLGYNPLTDLAPIAMVGTIPTVLVASPLAKMKSYAEFVAAAKANPGKINYASNGVGAGLHIAMERLQRVAGISLNHIPYKGGAPALVDMFAGIIPVMWDTVPSSLPHIQSGKLIPLAVGGLRRVPQLPQVPTIIELGHPGFDVDVWAGIMGPGGLPAGVVQKVQDDIQKLMRTRAFVDRLLARGFGVHYAGAADFAARIRADYARNQALFAELGIKKE